MKLFEGKTPAEKNKIIAASVLGAMAVLAIGYNIIGLYPSRKTTTVNVTASPSPTASPRTSTDAATIPDNEAINFEYTTTPIVYTPSAFYAPDAGRNIFAFYEPPPPTPYSPTPIVIKTPTPLPPAIPTPTPEFIVGYANPQTVYAGAKSFRLEINGDRFTPNAVILFNGSQLPTTFISPQQLVAEIPANLIAGEGPRQIMVVTPDGKLFSNQFILNVQAPPRPQLLYIGAKLSQRGNNNTAYFREQSKNTEFAARLNDVVSGRFRVISISREAVLLEDASLGFRHRLPLATSAPGQNASLDPSGRGINNQPIYVPPQGDVRPTYNVQPYNPPPQPARPSKEEEADDVEDDEE